MKINREMKIKYTQRWFCYLDLLGFKKLVDSKGIQQILPLYEKVLKDLQNTAEPKRIHGISHAWFSDTFIIYSSHGDDKAFSQIEQAGRLFFQKLILKKIPVRGAIAYGDFFSQPERNIFIGPALIDAYTYGEGLNWIGFVLSPSAIKQMNVIELNVEMRPFYREVKKEYNILKENIQGPVYAYAFNNGEVQGRNPFLSPLESMKVSAGDREAQKYENSINFIKMHSMQRKKANA